MAKKTETHAETHAKPSKMGVGEGEVGGKVESLEKRVTALESQILGLLNAAKARWGEIK